MSDPKPWEDFAQQPAGSGAPKAAPKPWEEFGGTTQPEGKGVLGHVRDFGLSVAQGVVGVPEAAVGLADIATGGQVGKFLENQDGAIGFRPKQTREFLGSLMTDASKQQQQEFQDADGVIDKTKVALSNPSLITNAVGQSLPLMGAGGVAGRAVSMIPRIGGAVAGAVGEGIAGAGSAAEQIRQETDDGLLTGKQAGLATASGASTVLFGAVAGKAAQRLGIGDIDTLLATGGPSAVAATARTASKSLPRKAQEGAISEGFLEELPQSLSEQVLQNLALDKPWTEGLSDQAVMGVLSGGLMGGIAGPIHASSPEAKAAPTLTPAQNEQQRPVALLPPPVYDVGTDGVVRTTEDRNTALDRARRGEFTDVTPTPAEQPIAEPAPLQLPAPVYQAGADGVVRTTTDLNNATQADAQARADRLDRIRRGEVLDVTPIEGAPTASEQMGLNPAVGPMSAAAALAVDNGASQHMAQQAALQQAAGVAQQQDKGTKGKQVDPETGEITGAQGSLLANDPATELQGRLHFIQQTARANGWDMRLVAERDRVQAELAKLQPQQEQQAQPLAVSQQAPIRTQEGARQASATPAADINATPSVPTQEAAHAGEPQQQPQAAPQPEAAAAQPQPAPAAATPAAIPQADSKPDNLKDAIAEVRRAKAAQQPASQVAAPRQGRVGDKLASGETVLTSSGRQTTPFPKVSLGTNRKASGTIKAGDQWLMQNALDEARSRGDDFNARQFEASLARPQQADKDSAEEYLFGAQPFVRPKALKPLAPQSPVSAQIEAAAHEAATSPLNNRPEPTVAQKEAGNYAKGHVRVQGMDITVENPRGSDRTGTRPDGTEWRHTMSDHYGYIKRTEGADGEQVDAYIGPDPESRSVFVVDQLDQQSGGFDEHKVMLGFDQESDAVTAYRSNFDADWKVGPVRAMSMDEFKSWLKNGDTRAPATDDAAESAAKAPAVQKAKPARGVLAKNGVTRERRERVAASDARDSNSGPVESAARKREKSVPASTARGDTDPSVQFSFAGQKAHGADLHALVAAQQRLAVGEDAETVRRETGWHLEIDGKWRFEISDHLASIAIPGKSARTVLGVARANAESAGRSRPTIGDVLVHPRLFAAYPRLARIPIMLMPSNATADARIRHLATGPVVEVQPGMQRDMLASAILHELQHEIQHAEGFAKGGSVDRFTSDFDKTGAVTYHRLAGEVEARNTQARMRMTPRQRLEISPEESADVRASRVLVTFNGRDIVDGELPQNIIGQPLMDAQKLVRAFDLQFPQLGKAVRTMLERGRRGMRGGVVMIDNNDPLQIAHAYATKTGTALTKAIQLFEDGGLINGFYDAKSGLTFLVGPNLDPITAPAVLLHEMTHGQQRKKLDQHAVDMLSKRAGVRDRSLREFLDRAASRMAAAGEEGNNREAAAYIVEQAVIEGRSQGFAFADSRFLAWVDQTIGQRVGDLLRSFLVTVRQWMLRNGVGLRQISVDDLVGYAMVGMERAARGDMRGEGVALSQDDARKARVLQGAPVAVLSGKEAPIGFAAVREWATNLFKAQGGQAVNPDLGEVVLDGRAVRDSMAQGKASPYKFAAFAAVKDVLERGALVHQAQYHKGESFYVSAPVVIDGKDDIVTVLVRRDSNMQRMYLHSVATKEYLLKSRVSGADTTRVTQPSGSSNSGDVLSVLHRLLNTRMGVESDTRPQFSRAGMREMAGRTIQELNKTFSAPGGLSWWHKTIGTMYNLAQRSPAFRPVFESAQGFIDDVSHYANDAADMAPKLLPKLDTWRDIAKAPVSASDNKAVAAPVFEGTLLWTRDTSGKPARVADLAEAAARLSTEDKAAILLEQGKIPEGMLRAWRGHSEEQFARLIDSRFESQLLKAGIVWTDAELRSHFKLSDAQVALYHEFRAATDRSLDTMARADMLRYAGDDAKELRDRVMDARDVRAAAVILRDHLAEMADARPDRAKHLMELAHGVMDRAEKVTQLQAEGYAPLSRFGKYTVDVVDQAGERQYFGLFETRREANQMAEQMRGAFPDAAVNQGTLSEESYKLFAGITPETLELFGNALGFDSQGDSERDQAFQEYLRLTKTNRSAMRRLIHRKGIAGYSEDVGRVLASFIYSNGRQTAAGLHMGDLSEAVDAIPKEQGELKDAAVRLADYIKNPQEEAQAIRGLLFAQYLGGSVASALVNMTQPAAVTFPWLSQFGGARKAAAELGRAARQMATKGFQYEADLARALHDAEEDGTVSPQEVHQLMAQARGSGSLRSGDGTRLGDARALGSNSLSRLSVAWGKLFGAAEQVNRRVTFIAAYRMAKARDMADPAAFAHRAVTETQFVYSKASKMQWGRGAVGGTLLTFKTYSIAYLELMSRLWSQGEAGSQERKDGRKAALLMLATLMLLGGAGGLPFAEDADDLVDAMAQIAGYNFSAKKAKQEFLESVFGRDIASFIDKGITGLPGMPLDVSGRLGMGNLIPGTGLLRESNDHSRDVLEIVGPAGDFASRILSGARKVVGGDIGGGLLDAAPTAVRNLAKGADMAATGMYRDTKGYKMLDTNALEAALKAAGFQPSSVATIQEANGLNQQAKAFYNLRAQEIRALWAQGIFEKDQAKVQEARDAVADWNAKNPDQQMVVRMPDVLRRVREMAKPKDQRIADTAPKAMRQQMREDVARARADL